MQIRNNLIHVQLESWTRFNEPKREVQRRIRKTSVWDTAESAMLATKDQLQCRTAEETSSRCFLEIAVNGFGCGSTHVHEIDSLNDLWLLILRILLTLLLLTGSGAVLAVRTLRWRSAKWRMYFEMAESWIKRKTVDHHITAVSADRMPLVIRGYSVTSYSTDGLFRLNPSRNSEAGIWLINPKEKKRQGRELLPIE